MSLDFGEMEHVVAIWFVGNGQRDVMGCMYRKKGDTKLTARFRERIYTSEAIFDGDDPKRWYEAASTDLDEVKHVASIKAMVASLAAHMGTDPDGDDCDVIDVRG